MPTKQAHAILIELFTTEEQLIKDIKQFLIIINQLKNYSKLPEELSLRLYFDTINRTYSQLLELIKLTCLSELSSQCKTPEYIQANTEAIIKRLHQALVEQRQAEYLTSILSAIANNETFFTGQLLRFSEAIKSLYQANVVQNSTNIVNIINANNQGDIIQYFKNRLAAPIQRLTKYTLFFQELARDKTDDHIKKLSLHMQTVTRSSYQIATPSKKRPHSITKALHEHVQLSTQAANQALSPLHEKIAPQIPAKARIPTMSLQHDNYNLLHQFPGTEDATSLLYNKLQTLKIENDKNEKEGIQLIVHALKILTYWRQRKPKWLRKSDRLYYQLYEIYFRLRTCDYTVILELIKAHIKEMELSKHKISDNFLIGELQQLIENNQQSINNNHERNHRKFPINGFDRDVDITSAHQFIRQPILDRILAAMQSFQQYSSGDSLTYPTDLEVKKFNAIYQDLQKMNEQLGNYSTESENFWIDIIKIFQRHTHIAGEFPHYFYHSKFGDMLRQVAFQLDQFKPTECRRAFELMTVPEGYHYTDFNYTSGHITAIQEEHRTPSRLCLNIQRIMDFYCNTGLGKLVAEDIQNQKLNLNQGWRKLITELDEKITRLYLDQAEDQSDQAIVAKMIIEIRAVASNIRSHYWTGKNSRLAGSLESLALLFEGNILSKEHYDEIKHLPAGVITSSQHLESSTVESYIKKHIIQRTCDPFLHYYQETAHRFFRQPAPAKLTHAEATTDHLNYLYRNQLAIIGLNEGNNNQSTEIHKKDQQFKDRLSFFIKEKLTKGPVKLHSAHGNSVAASNDYLKKIGIC